MMAERKKAASDPTKAFVQRLRKDGVRFVRFELPDMHGMARAKVIPIDKVEGYARKGLNMYGGVLSLDTASMVVPASLYHEEVKYRDQRLFPDFESVRSVPWLPDTVRVVCDTVWEPGRPLGAAPRYVVRRLLDQAEKMGYLAVMAHEFVMRDGSDPAQAASKLGLNGNSSEEDLAKFIHGIRKQGITRR